MADFLGKAGKMGRFGFFGGGGGRGELRDGGMKICNIEKHTKIAHYSSFHSFWVGK